MLGTKVIQKILRIDRVLKDYDQIEKSDDVQQFIQNTLSYYNINLEYIEEHLERISSSGPTVVVANHPFGGMEGLILPYLLLSVRKDVRILANPVLKAFPSLDSLFLYVAPYQTQEAYRNNIQATKKAFQWLKSGGMLVVFPAGEVSHITWNNWTVRDPNWSNSIVRMVRKTNANVIPMFFHNRNSSFFQAAGLIHPKLRTALLPSELLNKRDQTIRISIGKKISYAKIPFELNDTEIASYLRFRTYMLAQSPSKGAIATAFQKMIKAKKKMEVITAHRGTKLLITELNALPKNQKLDQAKDFEVYYAYAAQIPNILHEIGRLREKTFRRVGEGTGKSIDLDEFDQHYIHLFAWNSTRKEMIGAYRMGLVDQIVAEKGVKGLYTRQLFTFDEHFIQKIIPAIELGRSFIRPKYQKNYASLLILWKGISKFIVQNPRYHTLFGTVSISNEYSNFSKHLIMDYVKRHTYDQNLSQDVRPITPPKGKMKLKEMEESLLYTFIQEIDDVSEMIADYEVAYQGVPILLKHYLKLGGKMIGFNVDPDFQNAVDGLILVDLRKTQEKTLKFYMGKEGFDQFSQHHPSSQDKAS
ncbi:MAG: lysophospholipid acyltransferase family protein [Deltaproteobacteria bacterium]|nr:lysophospholipid acyltransferase family protein [Deltaproteobacteria bacterium]